MSKGKVSVLLHESDKAHTFEGDYDAQVTPGNCLVIVENVPNVSGTRANKTKYTPVIRTIYNPNKWEQVVVS